MFDISGVHSPWLLWCTPSMFDISGVHSPRLLWCTSSMEFYSYSRAHPPWIFVDEYF